MKLHKHTRIAIAALGASLVVGSGAGCGGNYSNGDVDFQLAVPARQDLAVEMPRQQALSGQVAEYYRATRDGVTAFNTFVDFVTTLIDHVRSVTPSQRLGDTRIWGPFPEAKDPRFEMRIRMQRMGREFYYWIEFHRVGQPDAPWHTILNGTAVLPPMNGATRRGRGSIHYDLRDARAEGFPVDPTSEVAFMDIEYQRAEFPHVVTIKSTNTETAKSPGGTLVYTVHADGSGSLIFVWQPPPNPATITLFGLMSRWLPSGAGRCDAKVVEAFFPLAGAVVATDCWGVDGAATYSFRDFAPKRMDGDPATCVFTTPAP